jgi:hypothetical protein
MIADRYHLLATVAIRNNLYDDSVADKRNISPLARRAFADRVSPAPL